MQSADCIQLSSQRTVRRKAWQTEQPGSGKRKGARKRGGLCCSCPATACTSSSSSSPALPPQQRIGGQRSPAATRNSRSAPAPVCSPARMETSLYFILRSAWRRYLNREVHFVHIIIYSFNPYILEYSTTKTSVIPARIEQIVTKEHKHSNSYSQVVIRAAERGGDRRHRRT